MTKQELIRIAERGPLVEDQIFAMNGLRKINATYHYCPDWDYMVICNDDPEHQACTCKAEDKNKPF